MEQKCLQIMFLIMLFDMSNTAKYNEVYAEPACQHNSEITFSLGTLQTSATIVKSRKGNGYGAANNCDVTIAAGNITEGHVMLSVRGIDFDDPNSCRNYIEVFNGSTVTDKMCGNFDYSTSMLTFTNSKEHYTKFRYRTANSSTTHFGFEIIATVYTDGPCNGNFDFQCGSSICISSSLKCDKYNNCGDRSDETICQSPPRGNEKVLIAAIIILASMVVVLLLVVLYYLRKRKGDSNILVNTSLSLPSERERLYSPSFPVFHTTA